MLLLFIVLMLKISASQNIQCEMSKSKTGSDLDPLTYVKVTFGMFQIAYKKKKVEHHIHSSTIQAANITYPANNDSSQVCDTKILSYNNSRNKFETHLQI